MSRVYLSEMWALEKKDLNIWQFFLDVHFSVKINYILRTAKGVHHAGEQEKKKLKIQGGLIGLE